MTTYRVQREQSGEERGDGPRITILFAGLESEQQAWDVGHTWLMEHGLDYVGLAIIDESTGRNVGMVSWEPSDG